MIQPGARLALYAVEQSDPMDEETCPMCRRPILQDDDTMITPWSTFHKECFLKGEDDE